MCPTSFCISSSEWKTRIIMQLDAWCKTVSYGAYLQPIHLKVAGNDQTSISKSCVQEESSQLAQHLHQTSLKSTKPVSNGTLPLSQLLETSVDHENTQNALESTEKMQDVTVISPYSSECLNNGEQMVLNVGGPVWAMDWLPSDRAVNAADISFGIECNTKKARTAWEAGKIHGEKTTRCKVSNKMETSNDKDGKKTAECHTSVNTETGLKLEWRFLALAAHPPCQVEDGKVVKSTPPDHYYDVPESARNLIQIWAVPSQRHVTSAIEQCSDSKAANMKPVKPRIVYAIDHESGVAWDMQWCPLVNKMSKSCRRENILGILAVCFGDESIRVFEVPLISEDRLQPTPVNETYCVVEKNVLLVTGKLPRSMQLSVQWSPHDWNILLTGASDGSVSLWNIETAARESKSLEIKHTQPVFIEPQRRFQDADTIGKQEAFDWGCGWAAIRAVAWSPFDEFIFATTGNDSVFKVWDVREPRVCLRSHRIRSTWGLALQWMDHTLIQISGDQGSVFMYDILSGSYQKLHFHPQIDSPVWDLQLARRSVVPLLVSSCTSGSIRAAPAKNLYRAAQNCVEICRLSGEKDSSIEKPFKSLTVSFATQSVSGNADVGSQKIREFCERDAALHRLRLSPCTTDGYPCFLATGGHAGLVILLELQELLDTLIPKLFLPPFKKIGRPKKTFATVGGHHVLRKGQSKQVEGKNAKRLVSAGRKARTFGSFAKAKDMRTALNKSKMSTPNSNKCKTRLHAKLHKKSSFVQNDGEVNDNVEEKKESEFEEKDESEDESDISLMIEDNSDDDRVSISDDDIEEKEEEAEMRTVNANLEEARLRKEYQLDLSEEDAYLLALQMSQADNALAASTSETGNDTPSYFVTPVVQKELQQKKRSAKASAIVNRKAKAPMTTKAIARRRSSAAAIPRARKMCSALTGTMPKMTAIPVVAEISDDIGAEAYQKNKVQPDGSGESESDAHLIVAPVLAVEKKNPVATNCPLLAAKRMKAEMKLKQPSKGTTKKTRLKSKRKSPMSCQATDQSMTLHAFEYQMGMSEKEALKQAIRLSKTEANRRSRRVEQSVLDIPFIGQTGGALPTPTQPKQTPATPRTKGLFQKRQKAKELEETVQIDAAYADEDVQRQRPQTPRRLQFSPPNASECGDQLDVPTAFIDGKNVVAKAGPAVVNATAASTAVAPQKDVFSQVSSGIKSPATKVKMVAKSSSSKTKIPKKPKEMKQLNSMNAIAHATRKGMEHFKSAGAKIAGSDDKYEKRSLQTGRRSSNGAAKGSVMSEKDALFLALKMSEIEY